MTKFEWPLFNIRIISPRLVLRLPTDDEIPGLIETAKKGIHDPETMPFAVPWTDAPTPEFERNTFQFHWSGRANWRRENWRFGLAVFLGNTPIGVQDLGAKDFSKLKTVASGSWIGRGDSRE